MMLSGTTGHSSRAGRSRSRGARGAAAKELAGQGHLLRLWRLPGQSRALGLWRATDPAEMRAILKSLPLEAWMTVDTTPLTPHPSDPALARS
jgi:muconolactone delta-isomerase